MSRKITNIIITGYKKCGKTTFLKSILESTKVDYVGFETIVLEKIGIGNTFSIRDIKTGVKGPISSYDGSGFHAITETFDTIGTQILKKTLTAKEPIIVLDEIGRFEKESSSFLEAIIQVFSSEKIVIAVLKKENLLHIENLKKREDSLVFDLNEITDREKAKDHIINIVCRHLQKKG